MHESDIAFANMSILKNTVCMMALLAIISLALGQVSQGGPHTSQGGPHENQGRAKRQAEQDGPANPDDVARGNANWTTCDYTVDPKFSCQDCNTRVICLPIGGKVLACNNVYAPYCNNGFCSPIPSAECTSA